MRRVPLFLIAVLLVSAAQCVAQTSFFDAMYLRRLTVMGKLTVDNDPVKIRLKAENESLDILASQNSANRALVDSITKIEKANEAKIKELISRDSDTLFTLLSRYFPSLKSKAVLSDPQKVNIVLWKNPLFLNQITYQGSTQEQPAPPQTNLALQGAFSSIGGLDVTSLADGMAKFLVARTKEELGSAFFERFKEAMKDPDYQDLRTLFPATYNTLTAIGDEIYNYNQYLQTLRASFGKDMSGLVDHLPSVIRNHKKFFDRYPELAAAIESSCYIASSLRDGEHPGDMLANYPLEYLDSLKSWKGAMETMQLISASLRDTAAASDTTSYWVKANDVRKLVGDSVTLRIYLGLLYQQAANSYADSISYGCISFCAILRTAANSYSKYYSSYREYFTNLAVQTDRLTAIIAKRHAHTDDSTAVEEFSDFAGSTIDWLEAATDIEKIVRTNKPATLEEASLQADFDTLRQRLSMSIDIARYGVTVASDIKKRSYGDAIVNVVNIYNLTIARYGVQAMPMSECDFKAMLEEAGKDTAQFRNLSSELLPKMFTDSVDTILGRQKKDIAVFHAMRAFVVRLCPADSLARLVTFVKGVKWPDSLKATVAVLDTLYARVWRIDSISSVRAHYEFVSLDRSELDKANKSLERIMKYGSFMAAIAQAKNSDDVESAIESVALPPGSYVMKRKSSCDIALNSYVGPYWGYEAIRGIDKQLFGSGRFVSNSFGLTAPIGISISTGFGSSSLSLFVSLVDIGAVAAYRFSNDSTGQIPVIHLSDIVSPGAFLCIGAFGPLSLNIGVQMGPNLRRVSSTLNDFSKAVYFRYSLAFTVDIPILDFYNLPRY